MTAWTDLVAVVSGGGAGIGSATARLLARSGAKVAVLDLQPGGETDQIFPVVCDVTDDVSVRTGIDAVVARYGHLDVLVNNVGVGAAGTVEDNPDDEWQRVLDVNVLGLVRVTRAALPHLRRSAAAAIVNTCSIVASVGLPQRALYSASKGAVLALTRSMAADHLADGIRVNCVSPATVETQWVQRLLAASADPAAERAALVARQPNGRLVQPDEVAAAIAYLVSPSASATTGIDLLVDGGMGGLRGR